MKEGWAVKKKLSSPRRREVLPCRAIGRVGKDVAKVLAHMDQAPKKGTLVKFYVVAELCREGFDDCVKVRSRQRTNAM